MSLLPRGLRPRARRVRADRSRSRDACVHRRARWCASARDEAEFERRATAIGHDPDRAARATPSAGLPGEVVERIHEFGDAGAETVYLQVLDLDDLDHLRPDRRRDRTARLNAPTNRGDRMDVRFGVHTGLQHTSIAELRDAVGAHRGARLRLDLDLGPLLRGRRDRRPALPRGDHDAHRARGVDAQRALRLARVLGGLPPSRGARQHDGDARPDRRRPRRARPRRRLARTASTTRTACTTGRPASVCACSSEYVQCVRGLLTQERTTFAGEFFTLTDAQCEPKPVQARLPDLDRRRRREGHARASPRSTPTAGTSRSSRPTCGRTRRRCSTTHCAAARTRSRRDREDGQRRHGVHRRGADAPVRPDGRTT